MIRRTKKIKNRRNVRIITISTIFLIFVMAVGYAAFQTNISITAKGNIVERSRIIQSWTSTSSEDFHSGYYKETIVSATFLDTTTIPSNAVDSWDISANKDKGVVAYLTPNAEDNTKYDLYIGANDGVVANEDSSYLFYKFSNLKNIDFNSNYDTGKIVNMRGMFAYCNSLASLDLSGFNTSNVTNMYALFYLCSSLTSLDLKSFDTRNVTNMALMFEHCYNLKSVNLTTFNTSKVVTMQCMFHNCYNLEQLNLCSFATSNVNDMKWMFQHTDKITYIYVGETWDTSLAEKTTSVVNDVTVNNVVRMFDGSSVAAVTTGQCVQ